MRIKQFYLKLFNAKTTMKDKTMMCAQKPIKRVLQSRRSRRGKAHRSFPAQIRRVDNLIFRRLNQFARANGVEQATPMHGWIIGYLYRHRDDAGVPAGHREGVLHHPLHRDEHPAADGAQGLHPSGSSVPQDARLKQLVLTEEGICLHEKTMLCFHQTDDYVAGLLTEEENTELLRLLNKLREALQ